MANTYQKALSALSVSESNRQLLMNNLWPQYKSLEKIMTFAGGTTNDPGDYDGTGNPATLFSVTGVVEIVLLAVCTTSLTGASATVEVGTAKSTAILIAQTTATDIDENEIWHDASPDNSVEASSVATRKICMQDIIQTVGTANITAGVIKYYCFWNPISSDGLVEVA